MESADDNAEFWLNPAQIAKLRKLKGIDSGNDDAKLAQEQDAPTEYKRDIGNESTEVDARPYGRRSERAAAYLTAASDDGASLDGDPEEIDRQGGLILKWAVENAVVFPAEFLEPFERIGTTTAEHEVFYDPGNQRVLKRTYAGTYGVTPGPKGYQKHATPAYYLRRLQLMNEVFDSRMELEGVQQNESLIIGKGIEPSLVISQPFIKPEDENAPHPSDAEISEFMERAGFVPLEGSYYGWYREVDQVCVLDARADNFIRHRTGVVPVDLVIERANDIAATQNADSR